MNAIPTEDMSPQEDTGSIVDADLERRLTDLIDALEAVPWGDVETVPATTAATFQRQVAEARERNREGL